MRRMFRSILVVCVALFCLNACGGRGDGSSRGNRGNAASNANESNSANTTNNSNMPQSGPLSANNANASTPTEIVETAESITAALLQMEDAWNQAYARRDEAWFQQNLADDYTEIADDGKTINDKAGATAAMKADKSTAIETELSDMKVRVEGNAAVVTGVNHVRLKDPTGKQLDYKHRFTDTFIKRDGRWLIWANESTRMP
jgi:ketosteroid isomerase-like protein